MSKKENCVEDVINNTFLQIKDFVSGNVVIGKNIEILDNITIIPVSKVCVGIVSGGGVFPKGKGESVGSSAGFNIVPVGFICIVNDNFNFISTSSGDTLTQALLNNLFKLTEDLLNKMGDGDEE